MAYKEPGNSEVSLSTDEDAINFSFKVDYSSPPEMDDYATLELVHRLSLQDAYERQATLDTTRSRTRLTDERIALEVHTTELNHSLQRVVDGRVVQRINAAAPVIRQRNEAIKPNVRKPGLWEMLDEPQIPPFRRETVLTRGVASRGRARGRGVVAPA